jgi:hypothetical protein
MAAISVFLLLSTSHISFSYAIPLTFKVHSVNPSVVPNRLFLFAHDVFVVVLFFGH